MHVCISRLVCTYTKLSRRAACVILTPRQQAATQIRLTGPGVSTVETDARAPASLSAAFTLLSTSLPPPKSQFKENKMIKKNKKITSQPLTPPAHGETCYRH